MSGVWSVCVGVCVSTRGSWQHVLTADCGSFAICLAKCWQPDSFGRGPSKSAVATPKAHGRLNECRLRYISLTSLPSPFPLLQCSFSQAASTHFCVAVITGRMQIKPKPG